MNFLNVMIWRVKMWFWSRSYLEFTAGILADDDETPTLPPDDQPDYPPYIRDWGSGDLHAVPTPAGMFD